MIKKTLYIQIKMSEALTNFANRDTKYNFILLFGLLFIFAICIVNIVDFRKVAVENDTVSDTYFSVTYANALAGLNGIVAFFVLLGIIYIILKISRGQKDIREIEFKTEEARLIAISDAKASVPNITTTSSDASKIPKVDPFG